MSGTKRAASGDDLSQQSAAKRPASTGSVDHICLHDTAHGVYVNGRGNLGDDNVFTWEGSSSIKSKWICPTRYTNLPKKPLKLETVIHEGNCDCITGVEPTREEDAVIENKLPLVIWGAVCATQNNPAPLLDVLVRDEGSTKNIVFKSDYHKDAFRGDVIVAAAKVVFPRDYGPPSQAEMELLSTTYPAEISVPKLQVIMNKRFPSISPTSFEVHGVVYELEDLGLVRDALSPIPERTIYNAAALVNRCHGTGYHVSTQSGLEPLWLVPLAFFEQAPPPRDYQR